MLILLAACVDPVLQLDADAAQGAVIYDDACTPCHGPVGEGTSRGPDLRELEARLAPSLTLDAIRNGRGTMPGFAFSDQELADLYGYLQTL